MNKEEQDKLWNELSKETKEACREKYKFHLSDSQKCLRSEIIVKELELMFGSHNIKTLTYDDVIEKMADDKVIINGDTYHSLKQFEKESAIHKLLNVAKYLNGDWQPDWNNTTELKYFIGLSNDKLSTSFVYSYRSMDVYFRSAKLAKQAIEILGEYTIKLALSTDY